MSAPDLLDKLPGADLVRQGLRDTQAGRLSIESCLVEIARLGGYLARANDPPPGNKVIWRGLSRLADITYGATLRLPRAVVGN